MNKVLILEPSKSVRKSLAELMECEGMVVSCAEDQSGGERVVVDAIAERAPFSLLLVDATLIPLEGALASLPFIVISSSPSIDEALAMSRRGALDYLCRPFDINRLLGALHSAVKSIEEQADSQSRDLSEQSVRTTTSKARSPRRRVLTATFDEPIVGISSQIESLRKLICKIAPSDARVMILGENGTGKELVARCIHQKSHRASGPFVEVNCAAIPSELIESELFGHEKGAFTSAIKQRRGKFEQANGGTLFLDEIGDMSLAAQAKVLRALQEHKICRVGSDRDIDVDVRVVAATNKDICAEIKRGNFREDLYHRIGVIVVRVVALRDHSDDIPLLVDHFLHNICDDYRIDCKEISAEAVEKLRAMRWSGNIRELRNVVERLIILSENRIEVQDVESYC
ncbi:MAG: sigma-54 dependent transcriptional regulator [Rikenellaceae bacterium]